MQAQFNAEAEYTSVRSETQTALDEEFAQRLQVTEKLCLISERIK